MKQVKSRLHQATKRIVVTLITLLIRIAWRPKVTYVSEEAKRVAREGPCILISNHIRGMDGAAILTLLGTKRVTGLVAQDMVDGSAALRFWMHFLPLLPIDRQHVSLSWLRESRKLLRDGERIYLCPEGRCNFAKVIRPFKPGFVTLGAMTGVPVVPIYHNGEYNYFLGKRWRMIVGEPVYLTPPPEGLDEAEMKREAIELRKTVQQLEERLNGQIRTEPVDWEEEGA